MQKTHSSPLCALLIATALAALTIALAGCRQNSADTEPTPEPTDFDKTGGALSSPGTAPRSLPVATATPSETMLPGALLPQPSPVVNPAATAAPTTIPTMAAA